MEDRQRREMSWSGGGVGIWKSEGAGRAIRVWVKEGIVEGI